jgi:hypothetical protein
MAGPTTQQMRINVETQVQPIAMLITRHEFRQAAADLSTAKPDILTEKGLLAEP